MCPEQVGGIAIPAAVRRTEAWKEVASTMTSGPAPDKNKPLAH
jgi:hypothetical protein